MGKWDPISCILHVPPLVVAKQMGKAQTHVRDEHSGKLIRATAFRNDYPGVKILNTPDDYDGMVWLIEDNGQQVAYREETLLVRAPVRTLKSKPEPSSEEEATAPTLPRDAPYGLSRMTQDLVDAHAHISQAEAILNRILGVAPK